MTLYPTYDVYRGSSFDDALPDLRRVLGVSGFAMLYPTYDVYRGSSTGCVGFRYALPDLLTDKPYINFFQFLNRHRTVKLLLNRRAGIPTQFTRKIRL